MYMHLIYSHQNTQSFNKIIMIKNESSSQGKTINSVLVSPSSINQTCYIIYLLLRGIWGNFQIS